MNSNSTRPPQVKLLLGAWTALWVVASMASSLSLWGMQFTQSSVLSDGMKTQSELLTGSSNEVTN